MDGELDAPCGWCGYRGKNYWQAGSHAKECPWREIGGADERRQIYELHLMNSSGNEVRRALDKLEKAVVASQK